MKKTQDQKRQGLLSRIYNRAQNLGHLSFAKYIMIFAIAWNPGSSRKHMTIQNLIVVPASHANKPLLLPLISFSGEVHWTGAHWSPCLEALLDRLACSMSVAFILLSQYHRHLKSLGKKKKKCLQFGTCDAEHSLLAAMRDDINTDQFCLSLNWDRKRCNET